MIADRILKGGSALLALLLASASAPAQPTNQVPKVEWITLGTAGGPIPRAKRSEPANALKVGNDVYLFDVGAGTLRQLAAAGIDLAQVKAIFVSHHHIDHDAGLGPLIVTRWVLNNNAFALPIIGPPGTKGMVASLVSAFAPTQAAPIAIGGPPPPPISNSVTAQELPLDPADPVQIYADEKVRVLAVVNTHYHLTSTDAAARTARSYSFRIESGGKTIAYTGDTGRSKAVERLSNGADLLVSEVIDIPATLEVLSGLRLPKAQLRAVAAHLREDHLTPEEVGKLAAAAGVKDLVLTHLSPGADAEIGTVRYTLGIDRYFRGRVRVAEDLDRF